MIPGEPQVILDEVRARLAELIDRPLEEIRGEHELIADLHIDSVMLMELLFHLETNFNVMLDFDDLSASVTVGQLAQTIELKSKRGTA